MDWSLFVIYLAACCAAAATGAMFQPGDWYDRLDKPAWTPPKWLFPVAWTLLYIAIAVAATRIAPLADDTYAMAFWTLQIVLNALWTPVFFGKRQIAGGIAVIVALWVAVAGTLATFWRLDVIAALLIAPYLVWVSYAAALNVSIWFRNRGGAAASEA